MKNLRLYGAGLLAALLLALAACGGGGSPSFTLSLNPTSLTVQQGSSNTTQLTITPQNGFTGTVSLSLVAGQDQVPQGLSLSPQSVQVSGMSPVPQGLTVSASASTPTGTYRLKVRATSGSLTREADLTVVVTAPPPPPDFTLSLNPTSLAILQGNSGSTTLTITPLNLFTGTVSLSLVDGSGNPVSGVTLNPTSVSVEFNPVNQTLTISAANNAPIGTYDLRVRGTINGVIKEAPLTLEILPLSAANLRIVKAEWGQTILKENLQLIEGKPALLRVHLAATPAPLSLDQPLAGAVYQGGTFVGNLSFTCPNPIPTTTAQGDLSTTCNATLPGDWVAPGLRVELRADPNNQVAETDEGDNALTLTPSVGAGTVLYLTVVPVIHYAFGQEKVPSIPDFSPTVWSIWPLKEISYTIRAPYTFSGSTFSSILNTYYDWVRLLSELRALRQADGSGRYYYGFVRADYPTATFVRGVGYLGYPVAVGYDGVGLVVGYRGYPVAAGLDF